MTSMITTTRHESAGLHDGTIALLLRVVTPQPIATENGWCEWGYAMGAPKATSPKRSFWHADTWQKDQGTAPIDEYCPFRVDQVLAVRENCAIGFSDDGELVCDYHADGKRRVFVIDTKAKELAAACYINDGRRSAAQMPLWAVRTHIRVTSVRCVRIQDLNRADIDAAGIPPLQQPVYRDDGYQRIRDLEAFWHRLHGDAIWTWTIGVERA